MSVIKYSEIDPLDCETIEMDLPEGFAIGKADKELLRERGKCLVAASKEPLARKVDFAKRTIKRALDKGLNLALSYSAGNDSTCLSLILVEDMGLNIEHVMSNTRMEDSLTIKTFGERRKELLGKGVKIKQVFPKHRPDEIWENNIPLFSKYESGLYYQWDKGNEVAFERMSAKTKRVALVAKEKGLKISDKCCSYLKKKPLTNFYKSSGYDGSFVGLRGEESRLRRLSYIKKGVLYKRSKTRGDDWTCHPLIHWTKKDVQEYLSYWGKEYRQTRNGCTTCMFGAHLEKGRNKLQDLEKSNPKMFKKAMDDWGYGKAMRAFGIEESLDFYGFYHQTGDYKNFDEVFEWMS